MVTEELPLLSEISAASHRDPHNRPLEEAASIAAPTATVLQLANNFAAENFASGNVDPYFERFVFTGFSRLRNHLSRRPPSC
jgi:hypothetical protein